MKDCAEKFYNYFFNARTVLNSPRLAWIDYAKGLTIILVVYHHSYLTLTNAGVHVNSWLINANVLVYSFRMPMFFILSGLFIERGLQKRGVKKYIKYRIRYLLYPYILWTSIQLTTKLFFSQYMISPWGLKGYLFIFYQPNATAQFWYLITLFNTALLFVILSSLFNLNPKYQFILGILLYMASPFLSFNSMIQDTTRFYGYLVFGVLISKFILSKDNFRLYSSVRLFVPLLLLMIFSQYYLFKHQYLYLLEVNVNIEHSSFNSIIIHFWGMLKFIGIVIIGCAFVLNSCALFQRLGKATFIRIIGFHSLYIYIMHVIICVGIRILLVNLLHYENAFVILPLQIFCGMVGSVMIYNICKRLHLNFLFEYDVAELKIFFFKIRSGLQLQNA